jgi:hypothetical protein
MQKVDASVLPVDAYVCVWIMCGFVIRHCVSLLGMARQGQSDSVYMPIPEGLVGPISNV